MADELKKPSPMRDALGAIQQAEREEIRRQALEEAALFVDSLPCGACGTRHRSIGRAIRALAPPLPAEPERATQLDRIETKIKGMCAALAKRDAELECPK